MRILHQYESGPQRTLLLRMHYGDDYPALTGEWRDHVAECSRQEDIDHVGPTPA